MQVGDAGFRSNTVTVEARPVDEACTLALEKANTDPEGWKNVGDPSDSFIDAIAPGRDVDPWTDGWKNVPAQVQPGLRPRRRHARGRRRTPGSGTRKTAARPKTARTPANDEREHAARANGSPERAAPATDDDAAAPERVWSNGKTTIDLDLVRMLDRGESHMPGEFHTVVAWHGATHTTAVRPRRRGPRLAPRSVRRVRAAPPDALTVDDNTATTPATKEPTTMNAKTHSLDAALAAKPLDEIDAQIGDRALANYEETTGKTGVELLAELLREDGMNGGRWVYEREMENRVTALRARHVCDDGIDKPMIHAAISGPAEDSISDSLGLNAVADYVAHVAREEHAAATAIVENWNARPWGKRAIEEIVATLTDNHPGEVLEATAGSPGGADANLVEILRHDSTRGLYTLLVTRTAHEANTASGDAPKTTT